MILRDYSRYRQVNMVQEVEGVLFDERGVDVTQSSRLLILIRETTHRESHRTVVGRRVGQVAPSDWHVIHDPMVLVHLHHALAQEVQSVLRRRIRLVVLLRA